MKTYLIDDYIIPTFGSDEQAVEVLLTAPHNVDQALFKEFESKFGHDALLIAWAGGNPNKLFYDFLENKGIDIYNEYPDERD